MPKCDIKELSASELSEFVVAIGAPKFRAKQIAEFLKRGVTDFSDMHTLPKELREKLAENAFINALEVERKLVSKLDGTIKYLYRLTDGECVETVLMRYKHGNTVCVSSQVGCLMGCAFCASTIGGKVRDLTASEISDQVLFTALDIGERVDNVVIMGIGEPLDNFDNVLKFIYNINRADFLGIGMRHITLSTCGVLPKIERLMEENIQITLSISLHAAENEKRSEIMPINKKYPLPELLAVCRRYAERTGRRITFEFALISGINDDLGTALKLAKLLSGMLCHVNLIPVNPVAEKSFSVPTRDKVEAFSDKLNELGIAATVRRTLGADINASCGQLRRADKTEKGGRCAE